MKLAAFLFFVTLFLIAWLLHRDRREWLPYLEDPDYEAWGV